MVQGVYVWMNSYDSNYWFYEFKFPRYNSTIPPDVIQDIEVKAIYTTDPIVHAAGTDGVISCDVNPSVLSTFGYGAMDIEVGCTQFGH